MQHFRSFNADYPIYWCKCDCIVFGLWCLHIRHSQSSFTAWVRSWFNWGVDALVHVPIFLIYHDEHCRCNLPLLRHWSWHRHRSLICCSYCIFWIWLIHLHTAFIHYFILLYKIYIPTYDTRFYIHELILVVVGLLNIIFSNIAQAEIYTQHGIERGAPTST